MKQYTLKQYQSMAERFNKMNFRDKITTIMKHGDILTLAADYNWWGVKVKDESIQEQLEDSDTIFRINLEWGSDEMHTLIFLLGMEITDI